MQRVRTVEALYMCLFDCGVLYWLVFHCISIGDHHSAQDVREYIAFIGCVGFGGFIGLIGLGWIGEVRLD